MLHLSGCVLIFNRVNACSYSSRIKEEDLFTLLDEIILSEVGQNSSSRLDSFQAPLFS